MVELQNGKQDMKKNWIYSLIILLSGLAQTVQGDENSVPNSDLEETLVLGNRQADYSIITEDAEKLVETAGALGDPLGAVFALPGVVYSSSQEPAVRGSSPNDNIFVVDFLPASYIFHAFGVSVFSEFILQDFQMYSAGFGPEYSNATGAVFDVRLRDPKNQRLTTTLDLSMLRSGVFIETGVTENSAMYLSARRSMLDVFIDGDDISDDGVEFQDVPSDSDYQFKYRWDISAQQSLTLSANGAADNAEAELTDEADFIQSNPDFTGEAHFEDSYSGYALVWDFVSDNDMQLKAGVNQLIDEADFYWGDDYSQKYRETETSAKFLAAKPLGQYFSVRAGGEYSEVDVEYYLNLVLFVCTEFDPDCDLTRTERIIEENAFVYSKDSVYLDFSWYPSDNVQFDLGVQQQHNDYTDETFTNPRFAATWRVTSATSLNAKVGRYNQLPELEYILPETGNPALKSQTAEHFTLGVSHELHDGWSFNLEAYYKTLEDLPRSLSADDPNGELRYVNETEGRAQGIDLMINKNRTGKWWGWFALSMSKSERTNLATDVTQEYFLDTPLVANWVVNYQWTPRFNMGWRWSIRSGQAYTPIIGVQQNPWFEDSVLPVYGEPYSDRLPIYNRLDIRFEWDIVTFGKDSKIILDIINALNYDNVEDRSLDYDKVDSVDDEVRTVDTQDIGLVPALTYRVTF
ncbi:hypothetical protein TDB9533_03113 [Thalassocella blandensis]|nr:hypothetical protein TDB9533_03113 [Thalassocella blandensis]